jgi:hypothetical protein
MRHFFCILLIFTIPMMLFGEGEEKKSDIAIRLRRTGTMDEANFSQIRELLTSAIINQSAFNVVEAEMIEEVMKEVTETDSMVAEDERIGVGEMKAADLVMVGSIGQLYQNIVIVTRLVDAKTRDILFSNTLYSNEDNIADDIYHLAQKIAQNGILLAQDISREAIDERYEQKDYQEALQLINLYMRRNDLDNNETNEILELKREIGILYAQVLYDESRADKKKKYYSEALSKINEAILLEPEEKYLKQRDLVLRLREEAQLKKEREEEKERERNDVLLARKKAGISSGFDMVKLYYKEIDPNGLHLAYSTGVEFNHDLEIGDIQHWASGDIFMVNAYKKERDILNKLWTLGVNGRYIEMDSGQYQLGLHLYFSPWITRSLKIANFFVQWGADMGAIGKLSSYYANGYLLGLTLGGTAGLEFKFYKSMGIFVQGRMDFEYYPLTYSESGLQPRISAGMIF